MSIVSAITAILMPAAGRVRQLARDLKGASRQRNNVLAVTDYAMDNDEFFPPSVAIRRNGNGFGWREPTMITGVDTVEPESPRSISAYLAAYIADAGNLFCPSAPSEYDYLYDAWDAGDRWNHPAPDTDAQSDPVFGVYCLFWNYNGYLEDTPYPFKGPQTLAGGRRESRLLICDYFGYGHWRNRLTYGTRNAYGSCQRMHNSSITAGTPVSSDFWSVVDREGDLDAQSLKVSLRAGYTDGHVERYGPADVMTLKPSMTYDGTRPYPSAIEPGGNFFIPRNALH